MADGSLLKDVYDKDVLALWSEKDEEASEGAISTAVAMEDEKRCAEAIMKVDEALAMQLQRELSGLRPR